VLRPPHEPRVSAETLCSLTDAGQSAGTSAIRQRGRAITAEQVDEAINGPG
jgi:hypothetical protein